MAQKTEWTCDGCSEMAVVDIDEAPADWKHPRITWAGLMGYPTSLADGAASYDLCPACARFLITRMQPGQWRRRLEKADPAHG